MLQSTAHHASHRTAGCPHRPYAMQCLLCPLLQHLPLVLRSVAALQRRLLPLLPYIAASQRRSESVQWTSSAGFYPITHQLRHRFRHFTAYSCFHTEPTSSQHATNGIPLHANHSPLTGACSPRRRPYSSTENSEDCADNNFVLDYVIQQFDVASIGILVWGLGGKADDQLAVLTPPADTISVSGRTCLLWSCTAATVCAGRLCSEGRW